MAQSKEFYTRIQHKHDVEENWLKATNFIAGGTLGQVWIQTLNSSGTVSFNALKKNIIDTQLDKVYQWDGSSWKLMESIFYQG